MDTEAQKVEALKKSAKYRRYVLKKKKHERNMAQAREHEAHRGLYRKRPDFDTHKVYAPKAKLKKVTSGRLSVPRGLFLKGKASSLLKKTGDTYLNALNYARKKEELGQIIKIGMGQAENIDSHMHHRPRNGAVKRRPEDSHDMNDGTETAQEAKRMKNVDRIKTALGLDDPGPSFIPSPTCDAQDLQFAAGDILTSACPAEKKKAHEKNESPGPSPIGLDSSRGVCPPERETSQKSHGVLDVGEQVEEMDDLLLEKLVFDIGLHAWNSRKPNSEPYENCDGTLIKEIISLMDETTNDMAKCNNANKPKQLRKTSEALPSLPPGVPQLTPNHTDVRFPDYGDEAQSHCAAYKQADFTPRKSKVQRKTVTTESRHDVPADCLQDLLLGEEAEWCTGGAENADEEPSRTMPLPTDVCFISPSTPPIAAHAFDPKAFMQDVEVHRRSQEALRFRPRAGCSTSGSCSNTRHCDRSDDEFNGDDYDTALSQCYDTGASVKSDDSYIFCNLYKYRRAMY